MTMFGYAINLSIQFFIPCYFGSEIEHDFQNLLRDMYTLNWIEGNKIEKKNFIIIHECLKAKLQLKSVSIFHINLTTFLKILQSAYSMYTLLRSLN